MHGFDADKHPCFELRVRHLYRCRMKRISGRGGQFVQQTQGVVLLPDLLQHRSIFCIISICHWSENCRRNLTWLIKWFSFWILLQWRQWCYDCWNRSVSWSHLNGMRMGKGKWKLSPNKQAKSLKSTVDLYEIRPVITGCLRKNRFLVRHANEETWLSPKNRI